MATVESQDAGLELTTMDLARLGVIECASV